MVEVMLLSLLGVNKENGSNENPGIYDVRLVFVAPHAVNKHHQIVISDSFAILA